MIVVFQTFNNFFAPIIRKTYLFLCRNLALFNAVKTQSGKIVNVSQLSLNNRKSICRFLIKNCNVWPRISNQLNSKYVARKNRNFMTSILGIENFLMMSMVKWFICEFHINLLTCIKK